MQNFTPFLFLIALPACTNSQNKTDDQNDFSQGKWIDLSYTFDESTIYWPTSPDFTLDTVSEGMTDKGYYYSAFSFCMAEHGGTHLDAPVHFAEGKQPVDQIPLERLTGEGVRIDLREKVSGNKDYLIQVEDFTGWEEENGRTIDDKIIILWTGFGDYWPNRESYLGTSEKGPEAVADLHFPGLSEEAAKWLVQNRRIKSIGLDTPSIDYGQSSDFLAHRVLFAENIPAMENLANLDQLTDSGFYIVALPLKIKGGSGSPMRVIAQIR